MKRKILVTGAAGRIGSFLTNQWKDQYDLRLSDLQQPKETFGSFASPAVRSTSTISSFPRQAVTTPSTPAARLAKPDPLIHQYSDEFVRMPRVDGHAPTPGPV